MIPRPSGNVVILESKLKHWQMFTADAPMIVDIKANRLGRDCGKHANVARINAMDKTITLCPCIKCNHIRWGYKFKPNHLRNIILLRKKAPPKHRPKNESRLLHWTNENDTCEKKLQQFILVCNAYILTISSHLLKVWIVKTKIKIIHAIVERSGTDIGESLIYEAYLELPSNSPVSETKRGSNCRRNVNCDKSQTV